MPIKKKQKKTKNILFVTDNFLQHQKMDLTFYPSVFHKQRIENNMVLSKDIFLLQILHNFSSFSEIWTQLWRMHQFLCRFNTFNSQIHEINLN